MESSQFSRCQMNAAKAISESNNATVSQKGCLVLFGSVFLIAGLFFFWFLFLVPAWKTFQARSWPTTQATIVHSEVLHTVDSDGDNYKPEIHFEYKVNGIPHISERYSFHGVSTGSRGWVDKTVEKYSVGTRHDCFYDPGSHDHAVLERGMSWFFLFGLFPLVFAAVGLAVILFGLFGFRKRESKKNAGSNLGNDEHSDFEFRGSELAPLNPNHNITGVSRESINEPWVDWEGPRKLKTEFSLLGRILFFLFFATFWNSVTWFVTVMAIRDDGLFQFTTLFMSIFVLVGAGLVAAVVYQVMQLFNPKVEIALSEGAVPMGEKFDVAWEVKGRVHRISELIVEMVGKESATYRRGTSTYTDVSEFCRIQVISTQDTSEMQFGSDTIQVPTSTMHSFESDNNQIKWSIVVRGLIKRWPDINDSYPFFVKPGITK